MDISLGTQCQVCGARPRSALGGVAFSFLLKEHLADAIIGLDVPRGGTVIACLMRVFGMAEACPHCKM